MDSSVYFFMAFFVLRGTDGAKIKGEILKMGKRSRSFFLMVVFVVMMFPAFCLAENETQDSIQLGDMVVSASRSERPLFDTPQSVTVISEKEIMASPFERIEDILRDMVGYENHSHYGQQTGGTSSHFSVRGVGRNRTLLLLDGVPLNDNFSNTITWVAWGLIPKEAIARVEIVRGPTAAMYGSEGLGGVVHIITKKPSAQRECSLSLTAGSAQTYKGSGFYSQKSDKWGFLVSGDCETSDGLHMADTEDLEDYNKRRYRDAGKIFGKVTYELGDQTDIDLSALYYQHEMGKGWNYFYDDAHIDQYRLSMTHRMQRTDWSGMVFLNRAAKTANIADTSTHNSLIRKENFPDNRVWGMGLQNTTPLMDWISITSGLDYKHVAMDYDEDHIDKDRDFGAKGRQETIAPFVDMTMYCLNDKLVLNAGLRYSNIQNFDGGSWDTDPPNRDAFDISFDSQTWEDFSPKAGLVYHPDTKTALRASVGTGFKAPSTFDLYKVHSRSNWSIRWANPELTPEEIVTWDIGGERLFFDRLWVNLMYYQSWATDYIGTRTVDQYYIGSKLYTETIYDNISEVDIKGVEAEIKYDFGHGLAANFNYTYNLSKVAKDEVSESLEGKYVSGSPRHKYRTRLTYQNPLLINASLSLRYDAHIYDNAENTQMADDYMSMDLSIWKQFDKLTLRLNVENLTNEDEYVEDGTLYYVSVKYDF